MEFSVLFDNVCEIKKNVVKLKCYDLYLFKKNFYSLKIQQWKLNLIWEFFWDDITYDEIKRIFKK